jgi:hypothetical protein
MLAKKHKKIQHVDHFSRLLRILEGQNLEESHIIGL